MQKMHHPKADVARLEELQEVEAWSHFELAFKTTTI